MLPDLIHFLVYSLLPLCSYNQLKNIIDCYSNELVTFYYVNVAASSA